MRLRENFIELCIEEVYDLIVEENHWPRNFDNDKKLILLNRIQKHIEIYQYETTGSIQEKVFN